MKILLGIICVILSAYIGYQLSSKYVWRTKFFNCLFDFIKRLRAEVEFAQTSVLTIIKEKQGKKEPFYISINKCIVDKQEYTPFELLNDEENEFIKNFFKSIGNGNKKSQEDYLNTTLAQVDEKLKNCKEEEKKYKSLYIKIGFLLGLIVFVLLL